jgi:hypothetical protein
VYDTLIGFTTQLIEARSTGSHLPLARLGRPCCVHHCTVQLGVSSLSRLAAR